jgi:hypothetical protein
MKPESIVDELSKEISYRSVTVNETGSVILPTLEKLVPAEQPRATSAAPAVQNAPAYPSVMQLSTPDAYVPFEVQQQREEEERRRQLEQRRTEEEKRWKRLEEQMIRDREEKEREEREQRERAERAERGRRERKESEEREEKERLQRTELEQRLKREALEREVAQRETMFKREKEENEKKQLAQIAAPAPAAMPQPIAMQMMPNGQMMPVYSNFMFQQQIPQQSTYERAMTMPRMVIPPTYQQYIQGQAHPQPIGSVSAAAKPSPTPATPKFEGMRTIHLFRDMFSEFLQRVDRNTSRGIETCGILAGVMVMFLLRNARVDVCRMATITLSTH